MIRLVAALLFIFMCGQAMARDDGRYANSPLHDWVKGLKSKAAPYGCCDTADGFPPEAVYDMGGGAYRVMIDGKWYDVPDGAVLTEPNKLGYPMVWYYKDAAGVPTIRCFIPGAGI